MGIVFVGDHALEDLGCVVTDLPDWARGAPLERTRYPTVGRSGAIGGSLESIGGRSFQIGVVLTAGSVSARKALLDTLYDAVRGTQDWRFSDDPARFLRAELTDFEVGPETDAAYFTDAAADLAIALTLFADFPHRLDIEGTVVSFDSGGRAFVGGTEESAGIIEIMGAATNPALTVDDFRGEGVASMTFGSYTLGSDAWLEIDLRQKTLTEQPAGTDVDHEKSAGNFFRFKPEWWDRAAGVGCTIKVTSGTARLLTRRVWHT